MVAQTVALQSNELDYAIIFCTLEIHKATFPVEFLFSDSPSYYYYIAELQDTHRYLFIILL